VLYIALRSELTPGLRVSIVAVATLTAAETGWAGAYLAIGEARPWVWLVPLAAAAVVLVSYSRARSTAQLDHA
jgi:hypothetical protein